MNRMQQETYDSIQYIVGVKGWEWLGVYTGYSSRLWKKLYYEKDLIKRRHWLLINIAMKTIETGGADVF